MPTTKPPRSLDERARQGAATFDRLVRPFLRPEDDGKFVAFDIDTGDYEIDQDDYTVVMRLRARNPEAEIWLERAGHPTPYKIRYRR